MTVIDLRKQLEKKRLSENMMARMEAAYNNPQKQDHRSFLALASDFIKLEEEKSAHANVREALRKQTPFPMANGVVVKQKYQDRTNHEAAGRLKQHPKLNKPIFSADNKTSADVAVNEDAQDALRHNPALTLGAKPSPGCSKAPTPKL